MMEVLKRLFSRCAVLLAVCMATHIVSVAQASNPFPNESQVPTNYDSDDVQVGNANPLEYVNANANTVQNTDRQQGPLNASIELRGNYTPNVFSSSQSPMADAYFAGAAPVGYRWEND